MTTLDDLSASLPNGFHDAELQRFAIDYTKREALLIVDVWVGDVSSEQREACRLAEVVLSGLFFWVSEAPDPNYDFDTAGGERIDIGPLAKLRGKSSLKLPPVPDGVFVSWMLFNEWNAFIYIAARAARLNWIGETTVRKYD